MGRFANDLAPQDRVYFELFEEAGRNMTSAAGMLHELLAGWPDNAQLAGEILDLEHEGDRITHDIIDRMNHTSVTPIERADILALASSIDDVVGRWASCGGRPTSPAAPSRSTAWRTKAIASSARRSPRCSTAASTRWS
jgi:hypothetical protein